MKCDLDPTPLSRLLTIYNYLDILPPGRKLAEFLGEALKCIPGARAFNLCLRNFCGPKTMATPPDACRTCPIWAGEMDDARERFSCHVANSEIRRIYSIETRHRVYGHALADVNSAAEYTFYEPYVRNLFHVVAVSIENRLQQSRLKAVNQKLRESRNTLQTFLNAIPESAFLIDPQCTVLATNTTTAERLGKSVQDIIGIDTHDLIPEKVARHRRPYVEKAIRTGLPVSFEDACDDIWVSHRISPITDHDGHVSKIAVLGIDITDRKQADEALRNSEARLKALSDASFESIFLSDKGVCVDQNLTAEKIFGYTRAEAIGRHGSEWIAPEDRGLVKNNMMAGYEKPYRVNALRKDGTTFPCEIQARMINHKGRALRVTALRDIGEQKRAEEALKASERKFRNIADNMPGLVLKYKLNPDGGDELLDISKGVADLFEVSPEDAIKNSKLLWERIHRGDLEEHRASIKESAENLSLWEQEYRIELPDGRVKWIHSSGVPAKQEDGSVEWDTLAIDVTEKKQREDALQKSLAFNKAIIDSSHDCIKTLDMDGNLLFMSKSGQRLLEIENIEPYLNQSWIAFWKGDDYINAEKALQSAKEGGIGVFEGYCPTEKGTPKWWDILISPIMDEEGAPRQLLSVSRDITDRKRAEQALRESEAQYRRLLDTLEEGYLKADLQGHIVTANAASAKLFGYASPEEMLGVRMRKLYVDPDDRVGMIEKIKKERFLTNYELAVRAKNGSRFWTSSNIRLIVDEHDEMAGTEALIRDITDRKRSEDALREKDAMYRLLFENANVAICIYNACGVLQMINKKNAEILGGNPNDFIGKSIHELFPSVADYHMNRFNKIIEEKKGAIFDDPFTLPDGVHWFTSHLQPIVDKDTKITGLQIVAFDITDRKRAEAALQKSLAEKEVLLREIHHRVKNNMQAITGLLRMYARRVDDAHLTEIFTDCRDRIGAMALIHEALYQSENLAKIDFKAYLKKL